MRGGRGGKTLGEIVGLGCPDRGAATSMRSRQCTGGFRVERTNLAAGELPESHRWELVLWFRTEAGAVEHAERISHSYSAARLSTYTQVRVVAPSGAVIKKWGIA